MSGSTVWRLLEIPSLPLSPPTSLSLSQKKKGGGLSNSQHEGWNVTITKDIIMKFQSSRDKDKLLNAS